MTDKVDKDTELKYLNSAHFMGFGLWMAILLVGSILPEEHISDTGRMWLLIVSMTYAILVVGSMIWTGYSRKEREILNANPQERKRQIAALPRSALFGFVFMLIFWLAMGDVHWTTAILQALLYAGLTSAATYFLHIRKPRQGGA
jgi:hypothetical protein